MGPEGIFISGSDFLMDGSVAAACWYGDLTARESVLGQSYRERSIFMRGLHGNQR